jgi:hypothetical protein
VGGDSTTMRVLRETVLMQGSDEVRVVVW